LFSTNRIAGLPVVILSDVRHDRRMDSNGLQSEQAEHLGAQVRRHLRYLNRLCERMTRLRFPPHDPLQVAAVKARAANAGLAHGGALRELHARGRAAGKG
jgi:hypothetical protein